MSTSIRVSVDVKKRLEELKKQLGMRSYNEVIEHLLGVTSNPKAALEAVYYWAMDVRKDVKKLVNLLEELSGDGRFRRVEK